MAGDDGKAGGGGLFGPDRWATLETYFVRPFIQGLAWGIATNGAALLISTIWFKSAGIYVCASCGERERQRAAVAAPHP
ncbi:Uncharacterized protein PBTT_09028 [Plasmodiophora brassicae]|uniref:Uncharacterized protein n=1 Tax=Plasmodiophora brassicae TaxID=37360 RepID=A0A0G4J0V9_PLABS|nr:hypothetical protein PBRA_008502 [Plasmodiophora brassicae]SPR00893.1 unnamed protein product [Plasmodiophora brassicae]